MVRKKILSCTIFEYVINNRLDKFDQFWAVNRRLMESVEQEGFKNIPLRCYNDVSSRIKDEDLWRSQPMILVCSHIRTEHISKNSLFQHQRKVIKKHYRTCYQSFQHLPGKQVKMIFIFHTISNLSIFACTIVIQFVFAFYEVPSLHCISRLRKP